MRHDSEADSQAVIWKAHCREVRLHALISYYISTTYM